MAVVAAGTAYVSYKWGPRLAALSSAVCITATALVGVACLFPERYGRWLRPLAVVVSGMLALAFGLWVRKNL